MTKLAKVHGPSHPYLLKLQDLYREFRDSMLDHIRKEDEEDFPKLIQYSQGQDVQNIKIILEDLINDHEDTGQLLNVMNQLTSDYQTQKKHVEHGSLFTKDYKISNVKHTNMYILKTMCYLKGKVN